MQPRVDVYGEKRRTTRTRKEGQHRALETEATMPQEPSESSPRLTSESIRRSVRTGLSGLSVDASHRVGSDIAERMLGHVIRGVRGI